MSNRTLHGPRATSSAPAAEPIQLKASRVKWSRLLKFLLQVGLIAGVATAIGLYITGASLFLHANGIVTRERIRVASPFEARITDVYVHPGDSVIQGQQIARVESGWMLRTMTDIAAERARISTRVAQLEARRSFIAATLPVAETSAKQAKQFMDELDKARAQGLAVWRSTQEISAAWLIAQDKAAGLRAERESLETELAVNRSALVDATKAHDDLKHAYNDGVLFAASTGIVGPTVGVAGQVLTGQNSVADIYVGSSFVLAYLPDSYLMDLDEGDHVCVRAYNRTFNAKIESILPVTEAMPAEFQIPVKVRDRGQLVKVELLDPTTFAIGQKIDVTGSVTGDCKVGVGTIATQTIARLKGLMQTAAAKAM
ncbi:multidrug transporter [Rhodomicrobium udaipurense JA643]|uniref:Multidrug transporter n=1 Tax=Rhodomicrobium udaipurense TaxID=1202716 RepID=A0A8I1GGU4_9HYPH|nr:multidrug transporter [Rhodomicrobium udaipurense]KAI93587.1 multidrug transporter [Rhodomicrobium udaipurense JA643]MBJ7543681.1 multidrug transporter [Rhodomicrobium udaipurense]